MFSNKFFLIVLPNFILCLSESSVHNCHPKVFYLTFIIIKTFTYNFSTIIKTFSKKFSNCFCYFFQNFCKCFQILISTMFKKMLQSFLLLFVVKIFSIFLLKFGGVVGWSTCCARHDAREAAGVGRWAPTWVSRCLTASNKTYMGFSVIDRKQQNFLTSVTWSQNPTGYEGWTT
jgi:hypothetical protein